MTHFLVVMSATVEFWNFKIDILGVQCPVNHAESGFNTNINLNIQGFFQLFFFRCSHLSNKIAVFSVIYM